MKSNNLVEISNYLTYKDGYYDTLRNYYVGVKNDPKKNRKKLYADVFDKLYKNDPITKKIYYDIQEIERKLNEHYSYSVLRTTEKNKKIIFFKYLIHRLSRHFPIGLRKKIIQDFAGDFEINDRLRILNDARSVLHEFIHLALYYSSFKMFKYHNYVPGSLSDSEMLKFGINPKSRYFYKNERRSFYNFLEFIVSDYLDSEYYSLLGPNGKKYEKSKYLVNAIAIFFDEVISIYDNLNREKSPTEYASDFIDYLFNMANLHFKGCPSLSRLWKVLVSSAKLKIKKSSNLKNKINQDQLILSLKNEMVSEYMKKIKKKKYNDRDYLLEAAMRVFTNYEYYEYETQILPQWHGLRKYRNDEVLDHAFSFLSHEASKIIYNIYKDLEEINMKMPKILHAIDNA